MAEVALSEVVSEWKAKLALLTLALEGVRCLSQKVEIDPDMLDQVGLIVEGIYEELYLLDGCTTGFDLAEVYWDREAERLTYRDETEVPNTADQENR